MQCTWCEELNMSLYIRIRYFTANIVIFCVIFHNPTVHSIILTLIHTSCQELTFTFNDLHFLFCVISQIPQWTAELVFAWNWSSLGPWGVWRSEWEQSKCSNASPAPLTLAVCTGVAGCERGALATVPWRIDLERRGSWDEDESGTVIMNVFCRKRCL